MKNAVIYARYSSLGQNEQSIEGQIRICTEYAESKGFTVVKTYADRAKTGTNDNRPNFQKMLHDAESGAFEQIIVYKFDRFARNRIDSIMHKAQLKKQYGIRVVSATEPVSDDEGGEIYEMFLEWNDERYSKRLSMRVHDGLDTSVRNGTYCGGHLIYGYKLIDTDRRGSKGIIHKVAIDEEQAEIVRYIFNEYAKGTSKKEIAENLNAQHIFYNGKQWKARTFEHWLPNRKYTGECMLGARECNNTYPPIIDKITFERVQERLKINKHLAGANSAVEPYILTGKAFCGNCRQPMVADGGTDRHGNKRYYYVCKHKRKGKCDKSRENKDSLERQITQQVHDFLSDKENARIAARDTIAYYDKRTGDDGLKSIETRIAQAQNKIEEMTDAFILARNDTLRANIERKMNEYEKLIKDLQEQKSKILLERGRRVTESDILEFIAHLLKGNPADKAYQKKIIDNLVFMVYIYDDQHIKTYSVLNLGVLEYAEQKRLSETEEFLEHLKTVSTSATLVSPLLRLR